MGAAPVCSSGCKDRQERKGLTLAFKNSAMASSYSFLCTARSGDGRRIAGSRQAGRQAGRQARKVGRGCGYLFIRACPKRK